MKETNPSNVEPFFKALKILQGTVADPQTAGLPDPSSSTVSQGQKRPVDTTASQGKSKAVRSGSIPSSYAAALTGPADRKSQPIGAQIVKSAPAKAAPKNSTQTMTSGAIGAKAPPKDSTQTMTSGALGAKAPPKDSTQTMTSGAIGAKAVYVASTSD